MDTTNAKEVLENYHKKMEERQHIEMPIPLIKVLPLANVDKDMLKAALATCGEIPEKAATSHWVGAIIMMEVGDKRKPASVIARVVDDGVKVKVYAREESLDKEAVIARISEALEQGGAWEVEVDEAAAEEDATVEAEAEEEPTAEEKTDEAVEDAGEEPQEEAAAAQEKQEEETTEEEEESSSE